MPTDPPILSAGSHGDDAPLADLFDILPVPALLFDLATNVTNINQSLLEAKGHKSGAVQKRDLLGCPIFDCIDVPTDRDGLHQWLEKLLLNGRVEPLIGEVEIEGSNALVTLRASVIKDSTGKTVGGLLLSENMSERRGQQARKRAALEVREQIWLMRQSADIEKVMLSVRDALRQLGVPFEDCGVNLVELDADEPAVWFHSMRKDGGWGQVGPDAPGSDIVISIWRQKQTAYRNDLANEDKYNERAQIEADLGRPIRSVMDVPFSHGTLAINNSAANAFTFEDITVVEEMAQLLSESFSRLDEFRHLEERNRELEIGLIERAQAEAALRESEEKLRSVVENAPNFIMTLDLEGNILYINRPPGDHQADKLLGLNIRNLAKDTYQEELDKYLVEAAQSGHSVAFEMEARTPWGQEGWFDCRIGPVNRDGHVVELTLVAQDTTARKQAEQALLQSHEELEHQVAERTADLKKEIDERKRAEEEIKRSLAEKEVLLQEIHHRVKNNLQIVSSLIDLQARHTDDEQTLEMFRESRDRIRTMALVHEKLYQSNDLAHIDLSSYIHTLTSDLVDSYSISTSQLKYDVQVDDIAFAIDMAIPCGLIINELLSNALKYAFPEGRAGSISIELRQRQLGTYLLRVADDGVGLPEGMDYEKTDSLGLKLVVSLVRQLRGEIELHRENGTVYEIRFSELHPKTTTL